MNPVAVIACVILVIEVLVAAGLVIDYLDLKNPRVTMSVMSCPRTRRWNERYIYFEVASDYGKAGWWMTPDEFEEVSARVRRGWRPPGTTPWQPKNQGRSHDLSRQACQGQGQDRWLYLLRSTNRERGARIPPG